MRSRLCKLIQGRIQTMWKLWFHKVKFCLIYIKSENIT